MREKEFNKGPWKQENVEAEASMVIPGTVVIDEITSYVTAMTTNVDFCHHFVILSTYLVFITC